MTENKSNSFENSLDRLKAVVDELERESVDLERSVELFREGRTLVARCEALLKNAELRSERAIQRKLDAIASSLLQDKRGGDDGGSERDLEDAIGMHEEI